MTYANGMASRSSNLAPRNSLDYWNKSEDWQGVTTYYRGGTPQQRSPYAMENVYAHSPRLQRPAPFPLNLPSAAPAESRRAPGLSQRSPSAPETGNYQNVPQNARIRPNQATPASVKMERRPSPPKDSPIFAAKSVQSGQPGQENGLIWSVGAAQQQHHHHLHNNHVAPISNSPQITRVEVRPNGVNGEKCRSPRTKPKWGRLVRTLCCCCVAPVEGKTEKLSSTAPPGSRITQVQKNGSSSSSSAATVQTAADYHQRHQQQVNDSLKSVITQAGNDYSPSPIIVGQISPIPKNGERHLLPQMRPADGHKKCLIIDLDETLVHSSFKPVKNADFVIPVEIDGVEHKVYVLKRPYVDEFLERVGERFECVLFTASLAKYADPVADLLDKRGVFRARLFREACVYHKGNYVKDLARLGRDLHKVLIIDNSPASYAFHPENAIPVQTWFDDPTDCELLEIIPLLERMERLDSVYHGTTRSSESPSPITDILIKQRA